MSWVPLVMPVIAMSAVIPVMVTGMITGMSATVKLFRVSRVSLTVSTTAKLWRMSSIVASVVGDTGVVAVLTRMVNMSAAVRLRVRVRWTRNRKCVRM